MRVLGLWKIFYVAGLSDFYFIFNILVFFFFLQEIAYTLALKKLRSALKYSSIFLLINNCIALIFFILENPVEWKVSFSHKFSNNL